MDITRINEIVTAIPAGRWMSYADVVVGAGEHPAAARRLNQHLIEIMKRKHWRQAPRTHISRCQSPWCIRANPQ